MRRPALLLLLPLVISNPAAAKESLGVFADWGAFRDPAASATGAPARCYAIAAAQESRARREYEPFASVGTWPVREIRGQVHFRLSRPLREGASVALDVGGRGFELRGAGGDAWARDAQVDAAILAAMRAARAMRLTGIDTNGSRFADRYSLDGAATAIDAASVGCARRW